MLCLGALLSVAVGSSRTTGAQQPPPRFQASVEVTSVDVTVVDDRGKPLANLTPADFNVRVDGNQRRVVTAEWVPLVTPESTAPAAPPPPEGYTSNENSTGGRLIVPLPSTYVIEPDGSRTLL